MDTTNATVVMPAIAAFHSGFVASNSSLPLPKIFVFVIVNFKMMQ